MSDLWFNIKWWWSNWWGAIVGPAVLIVIALMFSVAIGSMAKDCQEIQARLCKGDCLRHAPDDRVEQCMELCDGGEP